MFNHNNYRVRPLLLDKSQTFNGVEGQRELIICTQLVRGGALL